MARKSTTMYDLYDRKGNIILKDKSLSEIAEYLNVPYRTLYSYVAQGGEYMYYLIKHVEIKPVVEPKKVVKKTLGCTVVTGNTKVVKSYDSSYGSFFRNCGNTTYWA